MEGRKEHRKMSPSLSVIDLESDSEPITGVVLSCKDGLSQSGEPRIHKLLKDDGAIVTLVRASHPKNTTVSPEQPEGSGGRVTFTCPVMSRRHARLSFSDRGNVTIMDLKSLHGTYRHNPEVVTGATRLSPNVEYSLNHGDIITLGKEVFRDDKMWSPVEIKVELLRERDKSVEIIESPFSSPTNERFTPNRYGLYSTPSPLSPLDVEGDTGEASSDSSSSSDDDADAASHASCGSDCSHVEYTSESPVGAGKSGCSLLHLGRLPSLRDLGFRDILRDINSAVSRPTHAESQLSHSYSLVDTEEVSLPPSTQYPEHQLGFAGSDSQMDIPSSVPFLGGGSPEPEPDVDADEGAIGEERSRHSSPMELSSGALSRVASPNPVGAWPEYEPIQKLSIGDLSKQVMNALRPVMELSSRIGTECGKGKGRALEEMPVLPALPHPDECRSDLFLPPILSSPTAYEFDNVWQRDPLFTVGHPAETEFEEGSNFKQKQDNDSTESSLNVLSSKIQDLFQSEMVNMKDHIQDLKDSIMPLVERQFHAMKAIVLAARSSSAPTNPPDTTKVHPELKEPPVAEGSSEPSSPKQELQDIRDEMLRFSTLLEQVLAKFESSREQAPTPANGLSAILQPDVEVPILQGEGHSPLVEYPSLPVDRSSRKRKRTDECGYVDEDAEGVLNVDPTPINSLPPAKRQRRGAAIAKGIATAAGYTTLGAMATWATLAYYI